MKMTHDVDSKPPCAAAPASGAGGRSGRRYTVTAALLFALLAVSAFAGVQEVKLKLPLKPKLNITGDEKIAIAPFVIANNGEKKNDRAQKIDVQAEFQRYLKKQLTTSTKLRIPPRRARPRVGAPAPWPAFS